MANGDVYHVTANGLASAGDFIVEGSASATGAAEVGELAGSGDAELYRESDPDGDGTFEVSILIDTMTGSWFTQQNGMLVSSANRTRLRVRNTSGASADYTATGWEFSE